MKSVVLIFSIIFMVYQCKENVREEFEFKQYPDGYQYNYQKRINSNNYNSVQNQQHSYNSNHFNSFQNSFSSNHFNSFQNSQNSQNDQNLNNFFDFQRNFDLHNKMINEFLKNKNKK
jgi:hypothetical protein